MSYLATRNFFEDKDFVDKWLYTIGPVSWTCRG